MKYKIKNRTLSTTVEFAVHSD